MLFFQNSQWRVDGSFLSSVRRGASPGHRIGLDELTEAAGAGSERHYVWPCRVADDPWTDMARFEQAFREALKLAADVHRLKVDADMLERSLEAAWNKSRRFGHRSAAG